MLCTEQGTDHSGFLLGKGVQKPPRSQVEYHQQSKGNSLHLECQKHLRNRRQKGKASQEEVAAQTDHPALHPLWCDSVTQSTTTQLHLKTHYKGKKHAVRSLLKSKQTPSQLTRLHLAAHFQLRLPDAGRAAPASSSPRCRAPQGLSARRQLCPAHTDSCRAQCSY